MEIKQLVVLTLQISIICTVFGFGLKATPADTLYLVRRPVLLLRSVVAILIVMPLAAIVLGRVLDLPVPLEIGLISIALSPLPPLLPQRIGKAGGVESYGIGLMATLALLSIVFIPAAMSVVAILYERPLTTSPAAIAKLVFQSMLLPLLAGIAIRSMSVTFADRIEKPVEMLGKALLFLGALVLMIIAAPALGPLISDGTLLASLLFLVAGLAVGHLLGGSDPEHNIVLALATACRHPAIALAVAARNFPDAHFGSRILLYLLVAAVVTNVYVAWRRHHHSEPPKLTHDAGRT